MVTVRRDIAENYKSNGYSNRMNSYDRYVLENEAKAVTRTSRSVKKNKKGSYESYLLEQMNRTEPDKLLTENEYYGDFCAAQESALAVAEGKRRLTKNGKIFLAIYCITVLVVAIVLLVTGLQASIPTADASVENAGESAQTVRKMTVEDSENQENGWFEELCRKVG